MDTRIDWDEHHGPAARGGARAHGHEHGHAHDAVVDAAEDAELAGFLAGLDASPAAAIDLGCGTGATAVALARHGIVTTGFDGSEPALEHARERARAAGVEVEWVRGDVLDLPFADASFDLALDRGCLHHVAATDQPRYAAQVARVLRPGGTFLVRECNQPGHAAPAATEDSIRSMVAGTALELRRVVRRRLDDRRYALLAALVRL